MSPVGVVEGREKITIIDDVTFEHRDEHEGGGGVGECDDRFG